LNEEGPNKVLNSLNNLKVIVLRRRKIFVGVAQYKGSKAIRIISELVQFKGILNEEEGSNTENRLVIISFSLLWYFVWSWCV